MYEVLTRTSRRDHYGRDQSTRKQKRTGKSTKVRNTSTISLHSGKKTGSAQTVNLTLRYKSTWNGEAVIERSFFAEPQNSERPQPSSSSSWSPSPTWWSSSSWDQCFAKMALARVTRRQKVRPMVKKDKVKFTLRMPLETVWSEGDVQGCQSQPVSSDSMFRFAPAVFF